jgi:hypothetical protein
LFLDPSWPLSGGRCFPVGGGSVSYAANSADDHQNGECDAYALRAEAPRVAIVRRLQIVCCCSKDGLAVTSCATVRLRACSSRRSALDSSSRTGLRLTQGESDDARPRARLMSDIMMRACPFAGGHGTNGRRAIQRDFAVPSCLLERRRQAAGLEDDGGFFVVLAQLGVA